MLCCIYSQLNLLVLGGSNEVIALFFFLQQQDEHSHSHLAEQFKHHTIQRMYISLTSGVPYPGSGRIEIPIARDSTNRIRMAAVPGLKNRKHARYAASR